MIRFCNRFFTSLAYRRFLLFLLYIVVAAAAYNGFYTKWRLNDTNPAYSAAAMVEGSAIRPYVYRQFVPALVNGIENLLPAALVERLSQRLGDPERVNSRSGLAMRYPASEALLPGVTLRYHLIYYLTFMAFVASLFLMRRVCLRAGTEPVAATAAPLMFALLMPFFLTEGGYFYDFFELGFMMIAMLLAWRIPVDHPRRAAVRIVLLLTICALATWNKEAFFFFSIALYPLLRQSLSRITAAGVIGLLLLVCGCVYLALRMRYAGNGGGTASYQLMANLRYYVDPGSWLRTENTYGIMLPKGLSVVMMLALVGIAVNGWTRLPVALRQHFQFALAINIPLFLLFCAAGEMRNLSMLYPGVLVLLAAAFTGWLGVGRTPAPTPA